MDRYSPSPYEKPKRRRRRSRRGQWMQWATLLGGSALAAAIAIFLSATNPYWVPTGSMEPTLLRGDQFRADVHFALKSGPKRGEIWVFYNPNPANGAGAVLVKRVVGLPGEKVAVEKGELRVNGQAISEPYSHSLITYSMKPRKLGADEFWVLGDNRNQSEDSHKWGPLRRRSLIGRAWLRYWPTERVGFL